QIRLYFIGLVPSQSVCINKNLSRAFRHNNEKHIVSIDYLIIYMPSVSHRHLPPPAASSRLLNFDNNSLIINTRHLNLVTMVLDHLPVILPCDPVQCIDRKSTRLNSSHVKISYAVFCLKKKKNNKRTDRHTTAQSSST